MSSFDEVKLSEGDQVKVDYTDSGKYKTIKSIVLESPVVEEVTEQKTLTPKVHDENLTRVRSMALSYAKDCYTADKVNKEDMFALAERMEEWLLR